jgi:hypothetical protein
MRGRACGGTGPWRSRRGLGWTLGRGRGRQNYCAGNTQLQPPCEMQASLCRKGGAARRVPVLSGSAVASSLALRTTGRAVCIGPVHGAMQPARGAAGSLPGRASTSPQGRAARRVQHGRGPGSQCRCDRLSESPSQRSAPDQHPGPLHVTQVLHSFEARARTAGRDRGHLGCSGEITRIGSCVGLGTKNIGTLVWVRSAFARGQQMWALRRRSRCRGTATRRARVRKGQGSGIARADCLAV